MLPSLRVTLILKFTSVENNPEMKLQKAKNSQTEEQID